MKLFLPGALRQRIEEEVRATFPRECCGLLEGRVEGGTLYVTAVHRAKNLSTENDRFEIDPTDHVHAQKTARMNGNTIIGCYHSHPNGRSEPSPRDTERAWDEDFIWLIAAVTSQTVSLSAFQREGESWETLDFAKIAGNTA